MENNIWEISLSVANRNKHYIVFHVDYFGTKLTLHISHHWHQLKAGYLAESGENCEAGFHNTKNAITR